MKNSKEIQAILAVFLIGLLACMMCIADTELVLLVLAPVVFLALMAIYLVHFVAVKICKVIEYRKDSWPQDHKFLWVLVGIGLVTPTLGAYIPIIIQGLNTTTIALLIATSIVYGVSAATLQKVENARKNAQRSKVEQENEETHMWVSFRLLFNSRIYYFRL